MAASDADGSNVRRAWLTVVLRGGLGTGGALMAAGLSLALLGGERTSEAAVLLRLFSQGPLPDRLIALGMVILALTPAAGVATLIGYFFKERDYRFAALGLVVLSILVLSALTGSG